MKLNMFIVMYKALKMTELNSVSLNSRERRANLQRGEEIFYNNIDLRCILLRVIFNFPNFEQLHLKHHYMCLN